MNKMTAGVAIFLVAALIFAVVFVSLSPDFVPPEEKSAGGLDEVIWTLNLDDLARYLTDKGLLSGVEEYAPLVEGIATTARLYRSGVELYWWDLDNIPEGNELRENYNTAAEEGYVMFVGIPMNMQIHGPYGLGYMANYDGDAAALVDAFNAFCTIEDESAGISEDSAIWSKTPDDFAQYLVEQGVIESIDAYHLLSDGAATDARLYNPGFEIYWWDRDNLDPESDEYKNFVSGTEEGYMTVYGGYILSVDMNGPFGLGNFANYTGDVEKLFEIFHNYCQDE